MEGHKLKEMILFFFLFISMQWLPILPPFSKDAQLATSSMRAAVLSLDTQREAGKCLDGCWVGSQEVGGRHGWHVSRATADMSEVLADTHVCHLHYWSWQLLATVL